MYESAVVAARKIHRKERFPTAGSFGNSLWMQDPDISDLNCLRRARSAEEHLLLSVLDDSVNVIRLELNKIVRIVEDSARKALRWAVIDYEINWMEQPPSSYPFSFLTICDHFGLSASAILKQVRAEIWNAAYQYTLRRFNRYPPLTHHMGP